jgi:hypothetical protein
MDGNGQQFGGFFPIMVQPQQLSFKSREGADDKPPARVMVALDFLQSLIIKTIPRVAVNDMSIEVISPLPLSDEEESARATACSLLTQYFAGKLVPSLWEKTELTEREEILKKGGEAGSIINCPACLAKNYVAAECQFCNGKGKVMLHPV